MIISKSIKMKFFLVLSLVTVIPVVIVAAVSYNNYSSFVSMYIYSSASNTLSNSVKRVNDVLNALNYDSATFAYQNLSLSNTVIDELKKYKQPVSNLNYWEFFESRQNMKFFCESFLYTHSYINGVYIFTMGGNCFSYTRGSELNPDYNPLTDEWFRKTIEKNGEFYISDFGIKDFLINSKPSICFSRLLKDLDSGVPCGVLMLECSMDIFSELDMNIIPNIINISLVDEKGKIIFDNVASRINSQQDGTLFEKISFGDEGSFESDNGRKLTIYKKLPHFNWKVVATISISEMKAAFGATKNLLLYITIICIIIFVMLSILLSNLITKPITNLSRVMRENDSRRMVTTKKYLERDDEVGTLYNEYNNMINQINTFIKESYQNRLISLDSQMKALEAQINSHFLYNTLETISSLAEIEGIESIAVISQALGDMFRYSIKTKSELVPLERELEHTENYLKIQNIRYNGRLVYSYNIDESMKKKKVLKLIIQPLVENALYHAFEQKEGSWELNIRGYPEESTIVIEVIDNGVGIAHEKMEELHKLLNQPPEITDLGRRTEQSIGLKNIHSRIRLYYGLQYGLTVESSPEKGTKVSIRIPEID